MTNVRLELLLSENNGLLWLASGISAVSIFVPDGSTSALIPTGHIITSLSPQSVLMHHFGLALHSQLNAAD